MAKAVKKQTASKTKTISYSMAEFISNPAAAYAKVQSGQRVILTGKDASNRIVIYPGTLADYGSAE